jgi:hypothetical protein
MVTMPTGPESRAGPSRDEGEQETLAERQEWPLFAKNDEGRPLPSEETENDELRQHGWSKNGRPCEVYENVLAEGWRAGGVEASDANFALVVRRVDAPRPAEGGHAYVPQHHSDGVSRRIEHLDRPTCEGT